VNVLVPFSETKTEVKVGLRVIVKFGVLNPETFQTPFLLQFLTVFALFSSIQDIYDCYTVLVRCLIQFSLSTGRAQNQSESESTLTRLDVEPVYQVWSSGGGHLEEFGPLGLPPSMLSPVCSGNASVPHA